MRQRIDDVRSRRALSARFFLYGVDQLLDSDQHQRTAVSLRQAVLRNGILKFFLFWRRVVMEQYLQDELRKLIQKAAHLVDRDSFGQEPNYTAGFFGKLHGELITSPSGKYVELKFSVSNDRGPGSAESKTGIDIGLVFQWVDEAGLVYEKALLIQAKNYVEELSTSEKLDLFEQCKKMSNITSSFVVMDCPFDKKVPQVYETRPINILIKPPFSLDDYLIDRVFPCTKGDDDPKVVDLAKRADRNLTIKTNTPKPTNRNKPTTNPDKNKNKNKNKNIKPKM
ncbi:hypothetical protein [Pseudomonas syringae]|uniref:Uncharacterized protein n=3 Tax=Pseudomonas syringae TaxID=317 RepID=A0AA43DSV4_PSESX|nr:hypothetical protein [Pseudomonas syringae]MDH4602668.1 hypothetical protein [Pseudomonas syringae pv. papulans]MDH4622151.1 hypothetical protein [Pseudomonas syringae pv. papulans]